MKKSSIQARFYALIEHIMTENKSLTKTKLAENLDCGRTKLSEILAGRMQVGIDIVSNLCAKYPQYSADWLLNGQGEMLRSNISKEQNTTEESSKNQSETANETTPIVAIQPVQHGGIPLIPTDAMAGFANGDDATIFEYDCDRYVVPMFRDADFLIPVKGSSMIPKYNSGDLVACKRLHISDLFFQWNHVYVLDTDQGALIKRVQRADDDEHILCVSDNIKYEPFKLHRSQIHAIAIVVGVIRLE